MSKILLLLFLHCVLWAKPIGEHKWSYTQDGSFLAIGLGFQIWANSHLNSIEGEPQKPIFAWDKPFVGTFNPWASTASDWASVPLLAFPLVDYFDYKRGLFSGREYASHWLMMIEILTWNSAINLSIRSSKAWARPWVYHDETSVPPSEALGSFYSGHASAVFAMASYWSWIRYKMHANQKNNWVWSAGAFSLATGVATLRVVAGKHYPTDVIVGAILGSAIGWVVPWFHWEQKNIQVVPIKDGAQLNIAF